MSSMKVLIVGAGVTGALIASVCKKTNFAIPLSISVWEKSRGAGGRMSTSRLKLAADKECSASVDTGAQYISATPAYWERHRKLYDELIESGILQPLTGIIEGENSKAIDSKHFIAKDGLSSVAKYYLNQSACSISYLHEVKAVELTGGSWLVANTRNEVEEFDCVIITIPVPQILKLNGARNFLDHHQISLLQQVSYSSRFALYVVLPDDCVIPVDWTARYVTEDPCIRFISIDSRKRNTGAAHILLFHSSVPFAEAHIEEDVGSVAEIMLSHARALLTWLPSEGLVTKGHKWRYSQVLSPCPGQPGCIPARASPSLILAGDGFTHSNFDGCVTSAYATVDQLCHVVRSLVH